MVPDSTNLKKLTSCSYSLLTNTHFFKFSILNQNNFSKITIGRTWNVRWILYCSESRMWVESKLYTYRGPIVRIVPKLGLDNQKMYPCYWDFQLHFTLLFGSQPQECKFMLFWMRGKVRELSLPAAILITAFVPQRDSSGIDAIFLPSQKMAWAVYQGRPRGTYKWQFLLNPPAGFQICGPSDVPLSLIHLFPPPPSTYCKKYGIETEQCNCVAFFSFNLLKWSLGRRSGE